MIIQYWPIRRIIVDTLPTRPIHFPMRAENKRAAAREARCAFFINLRHTSVTARQEWRVSVSRTHWERKDVRSYQSLS